MASCLVKDLYSEAAGKEVGAPWSGPGARVQRRGACVPAGGAVRSGPKRRPARSSDSTARLHGSACFILNMTRRSESWES